MINNDNSGRALREAALSPSATEPKVSALSGNDQPRGLGPHPDWRTRATFDEIVHWAKAVAEGRWSWAWNTACKYVDLRLDTRSGAYRIADRDGNEISMADLRRQYRGSGEALPVLPDRELIYEALRFYFWAAGQGISPAADQDCLEPEEGFWEYCSRTGDEDWETLAERYRDSDASLAEDPKGLSGEAVAARPEGIAQHD